MRTKVLKRNSMNLLRKNSSLQDILKCSRIFPCILLLKGNLAKIGRPRPSIIRWNFDLHCTEEIAQKIWTRLSTLFPINRIRLGLVSIPHFRFSVNTACFSHAWIYPLDLKKPVQQPLTFCNSVHHPDAMRTDLHFDRFSTTILVD